MTRKLRPICVCIDDDKKRKWDGDVTKLQNFNQNMKLGGEVSVMGDEMGFQEKEKENRKENKGI